MKLLLCLTLVGCASSNQQATDLAKQESDCRDKGLELIAKYPCPEAVMKLRDLVANYPACRYYHDAGTLVTCEGGTL